jgi:hypothetical protein
MNFNVKKNQGFLIMEGVALLVLIVFLIVWRIAAGGRDDELAMYDTANEDYQAIVKTYGGEPTKDLVSAFEKRVTQVKQEADVMREAVKTEPLPEYSPTSFKVALKTAGDKYTALRAEKNVPTPDDFGWGEFRGDVDPTPGQLPKLIRQFRLTEDVIDVLFKNNVEEILEIDRNPEGEADADVIEDIDIFESRPTGGDREARTAEEAAGLEKKVYNAVPVKFMFRIAPDKLYPILAEIRNKPQFYRVRNIKTTLDVLSSGDVKDPSDIKEILVVTMVVDHIKLL